MSGSECSLLPLVNVSRPSLSLFTQVIRRWTSFCRSVLREFSAFVLWSLLPKVKGHLIPVLSRIFSLWPLVEVVVVEVVVVVLLVEVKAVVRMRCLDRAQISSQQEGNLIPAMEEIDSKEDTQKNQSAKKEKEDSEEDMRVTRVAVSAGDVGLERLRVTMIVVSASTVKIAMVSEGER